MTDRRVLRAREGPASLARGRSDGSLGLLPRPVKDESRLAKSIRMAALPVQKAKGSGDRRLRIVVWTTMLLLCAVIWGTAVCLVVGALTP
jgi:hypothetical protein